MKPFKFKSEVLEVKQLSDSVKHIVFSVPDEFDFVPGQYISIILDNGEKRIRRPYSIASKPNKGSVELCIKIIEGGLATPLIDKLKERDEVEFLGPLGDFKIESDEKDIVFISTGTGIGPFRSMIPWLLEKNFKGKITLIGGYRNSILYDKEFTDLENKHDNFIYKPVLSPKRVQDMIGDLNFENCNFYLCGLKAMIDSVRNRLAKSGVPMNSIYNEKYD